MEIKTFADLKIKDNFIEKLKARRITEPTDIQKEVIPRVLAEKDVIGQSRTGTGKTIAYLLPLLQLSLERKSSVMIIAPTKELARQIYDEALFYSGNEDLRIILLSGGESLDKQSDKIKQGFDIIIGVPGRIIKLSETNVLKLSLVKKVVLDEADFLIDLGFLKDVEKIFLAFKNLKELLVFSATLSEKTKKILDLINNQKKSIRVDAKNSLPDNIENYFFPIEDPKRAELLFKIINTINPYLAIIFTRTKVESKYVYHILKEKRINCGNLNGDMPASLRKKVLKDFRSAKLQYLVSTDLAGRGLDLESVTHIINYTQPINELDYLHRAGRTGRMNEKGIVYSLCNEIDEAYLKKYADNLFFELKPVEIKNGRIEVTKYKGVKPRFNLDEIKKKKNIETVKIKERKKTNEFKERRNKRRR